MPQERELELVELVTADGVPVGSTTVADAHTAPGRLHRAFSVLLFDPDGRTLLQQRSMAKTRFAGRWANTCCGHPSPGEPVVAAAGRRLAEELGLTKIELTEAGIYTYQAQDATTGRVEWEYDHVLVGRVEPHRPVRPNPDEVAEVAWADLASLNSGNYVPWLTGVLHVAMNWRA